MAGRKGKHMPNVFRLLLSMAMATVALLPATGNAEESAAQMIVGKWRHVSIVRVFDDAKVGSPQATSGTTISEFKSDGTWSSSGGPKNSNGTYRWFDPQHIEQTVLASDLPMQVGAIATNEVRVTTNKLELISIHTRAEMDKYGPPKPGVIRPNKTVVTSTFARLLIQ
jgi:hypothetical protein